MLARKRRHVADVAARGMTRQPIGSPLVATDSGRPARCSQVLENTGWGTWIRTKIDGVRVRSSTVELSPNGRSREGAGGVNSEEGGPAQAFRACLKSTTRLDPKQSRHRERSEGPRRRLWIAASPRAQTLRHSHKSRACRRPAGSPFSAKRGSNCEVRGSPVLGRAQGWRFAPPSPASWGRGCAPATSDV